MSSNSKGKEESFRKIKSILISQPKPERSPYYELEEKYGLQIDWRQFIQVEPVTEKEFRKTRIRPDEFTAIIFTAKGAVDHFFRMCEEMRIKMPQDTKYFCLSEAIANYLQKFIVYRKRKVFAGKRLIQDLKPSFMKHKDNEKFLLPCSNLGARHVVDFLEKHEIEFQDAMMYRTVSADLSDLENVTYDVLVFFSPLGINSLYENFPDFKQKNTRMAIYGNATQKAVVEKGLTINIPAPAPDTPSMTMALKKYLEISNKK
jgi:uroporphyrinogen-III synthase